MQPSVTQAADRARRALLAQASSPGDFDPVRYFRAIGDFAFLNVRTPIVRRLGRDIAREHRQDWTLRDAVAFADLLLRDPHLECKGAGVETLVCFRRLYEPGLLRTVQRWLADDCAANWATTDTLCCAVVAPLLMRYPDLVSQVVRWTSHRNLWVRRAAAVSLVKLASRGLALDEAYGVADALRGDPHDLIHKAVGWLLREAGRTDAQRLARYLRANGPAIPRTTVRYAIEKFDPAQRRALLEATRAGSAPASPRTRATVARRKTS